jgi:hypothetical protein
MAKTQQLERFPLDVNQNSYTNLHGR